MESIESKLRRPNNECGMMSVTTYALRLPLAKEIVSSPSEAIPAILAILNRGDGWMLHITMLEAMRPDVNPYLPKPVGAGFVGYNVEQAIAEWVNWGVGAGLVSGN